MQVPLPSKATLRNGLYIIETLYKRGGQALVYLGYDTKGRQQVVIKQTYREHAWARAALKHEAELLALLDHQSLPRVIDIFEEQEDTYLVMLYVEGRDLGELMKERGGAFGVAEVLGLATQLLDILEYLHKQDSHIIHRDINPKNLRLNSDNRLFLLDFGIAKRAYSKTLLLGGTPHYAPPEQLKDEGTDHRSDLYSMAATLYYLLTAVEPPDALSRDTARLKALPDPLIPANRINRQVPSYLSEVLSRAMSLDRENRPASALVLQRELRGEPQDEQEEEKTDAASELTAVRNREDEPHKRSDPILIALEHVVGRDATGEGLQLLSALRDGPVMDDALIQITIELMDSSARARSALLKRYAAVLASYKNRDAQVALNFIKLLGANSYLEPGVRKQLRERLGRQMADRLLKGLSSSDVEENKSNLGTLDNLTESEHAYRTRLQREWLRNLFIWVARGVIIVVGIQLVVLLFGRYTLIDILPLSSGYALLWSNLIFIAYTFFLLTLIRKPTYLNFTGKQEDNIVLGLTGLSYGFISANVLLHDLLAFFR